MEEKTILELTQEIKELKSLINEYWGKQYTYKKNKLTLAEAIEYMIDVLISSFHIDNGENALEVLKGYFDELDSKCRDEKFNVLMKFFDRSKEILILPPSIENTKKIVSFTQTLFKILMGYTNVHDIVYKFWGDNKNIIMCNKIYREYIDRSNCPHFDPYSALPILSVSNGNNQKLSEEYYWDTH